MNWVFGGVRRLSLVVVHGLLIAVASPVSEHWLYSGGSVVAHGLSCPQGMSDLPRPGIKLVFPALAGGFLTTGPTGKSWATRSKFVPKNNMESKGLHLQWKRPANSTSARWSKSTSTVINRVDNMY